MKLWIFSAIWNHISKYWNQIAPSKSKSSELSSRQVKLTEIKTRSLPSSTKKKGRLYKFNANEFSDSFEPSSNPAAPKTKTIAKSKNRPFPNPPKKDPRVFG